MFAVVATLLTLVVLPTPRGFSAVPVWALLAIDRLKTQGVLPPWIGVTRPVSAVDLRQALVESMVQGRQVLSPADQILLEQLWHEADLTHNSAAPGLFTHGERSFFRGREHIGWGPGGEGGLLFSDAAEPFDRFQFSFAEGRLRYTKLLGWLDSERSLVATRADFMVRPNLRIGLSESILMQGKPYPVYAVQPFPILLNQIISHVLRAQRGADDNYLATIDVEWIPRVGLRLFGEVLIDDLVLPVPKPNPFPSRWGATVGVQSTQPGGDSYLLRYTIVPNWTYSATKAVLHYLEHDISLGHPLGADFDTILVRWMSPADQRLAAWATYTRKGEGEVGKSWGDVEEATTYPFLRGVVEYSMIVGLDLAIQGDLERIGTVSPWVRLRQNAGHVQGRVVTDWGVGAALQWSY